MFLKRASGEVRKKNRGPDVEQDIRGAFDLLIIGGG
jgi:hypothetical protein